MKTILVATDFSNAAGNALKYAMGLAKAFNAKIIVYSAFQEAPVPVDGSPMIITPEDTGKLMSARMKEELKLLDPAGKLAIDTIVREATPAQGIRQAAKDNNADLIITGMKAGEKGIRRFFGSTVTALIHKIEIPMLVIPEEASYQDISNIAYATEKDLDIDEKLAELNTIREIAERYHAHLYLVRVAENRFKEAFELLNRPFQLIRQTRTLNPIYETVEGKDITEALNQFAVSYKINMLVLHPHKQGGIIERWFAGSTTRQMVFESHIPLLVLPKQ